LYKRLRECIEVIPNKIKITYLGKYIDTKHQKKYSIENLLNILIKKIRFLG